MIHSLSKNTVTVVKCEGEGPLSFDALLFLWKSLTYTILLRKQKKIGLVNGKKRKRHITFIVKHARVYELKSRTLVTYKNVYRIIIQRI